MCPLINSPNIMSFKISQLSVQYITMKENKTQNKLITVSRGNNTFTIDKSQIALSFLAMFVFLLNEGNTIDGDWKSLKYSFKSIYRIIIALRNHFMSPTPTPRNTGEDNWLIPALFPFSLPQGVVLPHNTSARVIRSNQSLVLQKVTRHSSGNYSCSAVNSEGETVSNHLQLRVQCKFPNW